MGKKCTLFCDIDGTLFKYREFTEYKNILPTAISTTITTINKTYDGGHYIVLTTARPEYLRMHTIYELDYARIKYHQLIMGIGRGPRILINDNKEKYIDRAFAFNLERDVGLNTQDISNINHTLKFKENLRAEHLP